MAFSKAMKATLRALSYPDIQMTKNYRLVRKVIEITHAHKRTSKYHGWDYRVYYKDHEIPIRIFMANENQGNPILIFFHGGGWVTGNIDSYTNVCANMAKITAHTVISVDYQLAPEYKFPAAPEDCYHAALEIYRHAEECFSVDQDKITLMGDSAGGNLAAAVSLMARDRGEFSPKKQILLYPVVNNDFSDQSQFRSVVENGTDYLLTSKRMRDYMELYQSCEEDLQNPYFAPIVEKSPVNLPETLIITAEYDPLRDEGEAFGRKLTEYGNKVEIHRIEDALHGFFSTTVKLPPLQECYRWITRFLRENI